MNPIETHEKNLAWIDKQIDLYTFALRQSMDDSEFNATSSGRKSLRANRKVLERHGPRVIGFRYSDNVPTGYECSACQVVYPCPNTTDITDELGIE